MHNFNVRDRRYLPDFINIKKINIDDQELIFGIGILLVQLLSKSIDLPTHLYLPSNQLFHIHLIMKKLERQPISSYTLEIINTCLSKKNRETIYNQYNQDQLIIFEKMTKFEYDMKDQLLFTNINELKRAIETTISRLEKNRFTYEDKQRMLIPVSLKTLQKTDFEGVTDNNE